MPRAKLVAIKNFDEELYRLVKAYASLEKRTIASIFEEAIRQWLMSRRDYEELRLWIHLEESYNNNLKVLEENKHQLENKEGYAAICDGKLLGVFPGYLDASRESRKRCKNPALIVQLPYHGRERNIELGLPW